MAQVFVSYKHENSSQDFIQHLRQKLEENGFDVWIDRILLLPGEDWKKEIDNAIKASIALIVIMTPEARKSEYITYEWAFAAGRDIPVIPIILQKMELHPRLNDIQFVDFSNTWNAKGVHVNWDKLIAKLRIEVDKYEKRNEIKKIPPAIQRATDEFNSPNPDIRLKAIQNLSAMLPYEPAVEALCEALNTHPYPDIRQFAADFLGQLRSVELTHIFQEKLNDPNPWVQHNVIHALENLGTDDAFQIISKTYAKDLNPTAKIAIINALGTFAREESIPFLKGLLGDAILRKSVTVSLAQIGTEECREIISHARSHIVYAEIEVRQILDEFKRLSVKEEFSRFFNFGV